MDWISSLKHGLRLSNTDADEAAVQLATVVDSTESGSTTQDPAEDWRLQGDQNLTRRVGRFRRAASSIESAALAGAACAILLPLSSRLLLRQPGLGTSEAQRATWYADPGNQRWVLIGLSLAPFAAIAFLWFIAVIRRRLGEREDQFFSTVFLGSGFAFAFLTVISAAAAATPTLVVRYSQQEVPSPDVLALAHSLWFGLFVVSASRFAAVFMIVTSTIGMMFRALPRWVGICGYAFGLVLFVTGAFSDPLEFLFPVWLLVVSITLLVSRRVVEQEDGLSPQA